MARSRKKYPIVSDYSRGKNGTKSSKRLAAKAVRNYKGVIPDGSAYRKLYPTWDIHDWKWWVEEGKGHYYVTTEEDVKRALRK